jgi:hypothetical protein
VDLGISSTTAGHHVRLALLFCATVLGLILLGSVFGSSSASADDGGPDDGGLVPVVADLAGGVVETVAPVTAPATEAIPLVDVPLSPAATTVATVTTIVPVTGHVLGTTPVEPLVGTLTKTLDTTLDTLTGALAPVVDLLSAAIPATATAQAVAASTVPAAGALIAGSAEGPWNDAREPFGTGSNASGASVTTTALPAAALGAGFLVLLFSRRLGLVHSTLPVSPVYETDTSPD